MDQTKTVCLLSFFESQCPLMVGCVDVVDFAANFCAAYGITDLPTNATQGCNPIVYPPGLPNCTHSCVDYDFDGCSIDDPACICASPELVQRYSCCVAEQCNGPDQDSTFVLVSLGDPISANVRIFRCGRHRCQLLCRVWHKQSPYKRY